MRGTLYHPKRGTLYRDEGGVVHATRRKRMTIFLCEEENGHKDFGACVNEADDPTIEVVTCLHCLTL